MAKHIYVSSVINGGAIGDQSYATQQSGNITGLVSTRVYNTIEDVTTELTLAAGDIIYCANNHAASYAPAATVVLCASAAGVEGTRIISVDNANIQNYLAGASEENTAGVPEYWWGGKTTIIGVSFKGGDSGFAPSAYGGSVVFQDLKLETDGGNRDYVVYNNLAGNLTELIDVELISGGALTDFFHLSSGSHLYWYGGKVTGSAMPDTMFAGLGDTGGATVIFNGVDLSLFNKPFFPTLTAATADLIRMTIRNCQLHADVTFPSPGNNLFNAVQRFEAYGCDDNTGNAMHRFYIADGIGMVRNNDSTYVDADTAWYEGTDKSSYEINTTGTFCSATNPFVFELPTQYIDLGDTASDKVSLDILIDTVALTTLTDADINISMLYPDKTTPILSRYIGSTINPTGSGVELSTTGALADSDWTKSISDANAKQYRMNLDTSGVAGEAFAVTVRVEIYRADIGWGELFIGSELVVGT